MSRHRFISWGVALCCLIVLSLPARGAATAFLKVDGIKGDSQDKAHPQQIEIASFSAGVTQNVSATAGGGMGAGKAAIAPFTVTKAIDSSSPQFFLYTCNGKHIPTVVLELVSAGETQQPILRYTLTDAIVASVQTSGGGGAGAEKPSEQISFAFSKISIEFMGQNEKGAAGAKQEVMWDLKTQKGASASPTGAPDGSAAAAATAAPDAGTAGAGAAAAAGGAAGAAPAAGGAAPAAGATDPAAAPPAAGSKTLTRAQRERMKLQQAQPGQVAPAQPK
jgi:type VI secretion system secreted protein Hcp